MKKTTTIEEKEFCGSCKAEMFKVITGIDVNKKDCGETT